MEALSADPLEFYMRFFHPEKLCSALPGHEGLNPDECARLYGTSLERYRTAMESFSARNEAIVDGLVRDPDFFEISRRLPFQEGDRVVAFGDSITEDRLSWAELLASLLARVAPHRGIEVVNAGVSGDTTAQGVARFLSTIAGQPRWIVFMIGTNDARRHGWEAARTQIGAEETAANLKTMHEMAKRRTEARLVWMTPTPVLEEKFADHWLLGPQEAWYLNRDLMRVAHAVGAMPGLHVDVWEAFRRELGEELYMDDGLHPSSFGQALILRSLVGVLSSEAA